MKHIHTLFSTSLALVGIAATILNAQNLPPNFGTPQGTNALASSAGFIDILGVKLGMPAEQALSILKATYPASKITLERTPDYESAWYRLERENPDHKWVSTISVRDAAAGENISVGLSLPPSKQVVQAVGRASYFKAPVAVENIVAGLHKKYGMESYSNTFYGMTKTLLWVYDTQGNRVKPDWLTNHPIAMSCAVGFSGNMAGAQVSLQHDRPYDTTVYAPNRCNSFVILSASIRMASASAGMTGEASGFDVVAYDWPLVTSGANALYAFLDQGARDIAAKQVADAKKRGAGLKY